jgi:hypothetical protein
MIGHLLRHLELSAIAQIFRDAGRAETVAANQHDVTWFPCEPGNVDGRADGAKTQCLSIVTRVSRSSNVQWPKDSPTAPCRSLRGRVPAPGHSGSKNVPLAAGLGLHEALKFSLLALRHFNRYRCSHDRHPTKKPSHYKISFMGHYTRSRPHQRRNASMSGARMISFWMAITSKTSPPTVRRSALSNPHYGDF